MKRTSVVIAALAVIALAAGDAALAAPRKKAKQPACVDGPAPFSWNFLLFGPAPQPNGCSPPVYSNGQFIGQDPDPFIRQQLLRDPATGNPMNY